MEKIRQIIAAIKAWYDKSGITSLLWLGIAVAVVILPGTPFLKGLGLGVSIGIFVYINWNIIRKLIKDNIVDKIK
jgi:hypothetical protein